MPVPEKIKLGDKDYILKDHPELLELVQEARKDEKDKLYSRISTLEASEKVLKDKEKAGLELTTKQEADLKKIQDELAVSKAELEKVSKNKSKAGDDDDEEDEDEDGGGKGKKGKSTKAKGLTLEEVKAAMAEILAAKDKEFDQKLNEVKTGLSKKNVGDYRKEQLAKHKGLIIEDLVPEDLESEEAVNKAIEKALKTSKGFISKEFDVDGKKQRMTLAEYEELAGKKEGAAGAGGSGEGTPSYTPREGAPKPGTPSGDVTGKELIKDVANMSEEEYAKHRKELLKEAKTLKYTGDEE